MSAAGMMERIAEASPDRKARLAGVFYSINIAVGLLALSIGFALVARSDAASALAAILAGGSLFRSGFAPELIAIAGCLAVVPVFYRLFRPVNSGLSFIAAFVGFVANAVLALNTLNLFAPLLLLRAARYLNVFDLEQLQALALVFLELHGRGHIIGLTFFGFYCLLIGHLIFRSAFLPHSLSVLMTIAGLAWLTDSFVSLLSRPLAKDLYPWILAPGLFGEAALCLWILAIGVNARRSRRASSPEPSVSVSSVTG